MDLSRLRSLGDQTPQARNGTYHHLYPTTRQSDRNRHKLNNKNNLCRCFLSGWHPTPARHTRQAERTEFALAGVSGKCRVRDPTGVLVLSCLFILTYE